MTGRPMSSYFGEKKNACPFSRLELVLLPQDNDRTHLRELIRQRFEHMLKHGLIAETQELLDRGIDANAPAMRAVGYRQVAMYLQGEVSYDEMVELGVIATARLAKHQMTWLRGGLKDATAAGAATAVDAANTASAAAAADAAAAAGDAVYSERHYLTIEDEHKWDQVLAILQQHPQLWAFHY